MKAFFFYGLARIFYIVTSIGITKILTSALDIKSFGELDLYLTIIPLGSSLLGFGLPSALNRELNLYNRETKSLFTIVFIYVFKVFIILLLIYIFNLALSFLSVNILLLLEINILLIILNDYFIGILRGLNRAKEYLIGIILQYTTYIWLLFQYKSDLTVKLILVFYALSTLVSILYFIFIFRKELLGGKFSKEIYKSVLFFGTPLMFSGIAGFIFNSSDKYILAIYTNLEIVALYSIGYKIASVLNIPIGIFQMGWPRYMYKIYNDNEKKNYQFLYDLIARCYLYMLMLFGAIIIVSDEYILDIFANTNYKEGLRIVPIVIAGIVLYGMHFITSNGINIKGKSSIIPISLIIGAIFNLVLNLIFIPKYGMLAAAWTTFLSMAIIFIIVFYYSNKYLPVQYKTKRIFISYILFLVIIFSFDNLSLLLVLLNSIILFTKDDLFYIARKINII